MGLDIEQMKTYLRQCDDLAIDPKTPFNTDLTTDSPVNYSLIDNGKSVIAENIIGTRTFRHMYTLIATYDTNSDTYRSDNNRITHAFQSWLMEQNDNKDYPPITGGNIEKMVASEAVFMGFDGNNTKYGRYSTVFFIEYKEVK